MTEKKLSFPIKALIFISIAAFVICLLWFLGFVIDILLLVFAGVLLAILLRAIARLFQKLMPLSENISLLFAILTIILIITGFLFIIGPELVSGINDISKQLPSSLTMLETEVKKLPWGDKLVRNIKNSTENFVSDSKITSRVSGVFSSAISAITGLLVVLVIGLYGAYDPKLYTKNFLKLIPKKKQKRAAEIIGAIENSLVWWLAGQFSSMLILGILTSVGLWILGIPFALTLGIIAAVLSFVPNIGPIISAVPAVLIALMESPSKALYVIILYVGVQTVESYLITPVIQKKAVYLAPALLISVQIMVGVLLGALGLLLATPLMVVVIVLVQMIYVQDILGYDVTVLGDHENNNE